MDDRPGVLAAQRGREPARNKTVHDLHARDVARVRHDLDQRPIERQRGLLHLRQIRKAGLAQQFGPFAVRPVGVGGVHTVDVLDDREAGGAKRVRDEERAGVGAMRRDARRRELMVVVRREGAAHDRAGRGEMDGELARHGRMLDIGDAFRREQAGEDVAVLSGLARRKRRQRADRQAEIETDAVEMARADAGPGQDQQPVLGQKPANLIHQRDDRLMAAIHDGPAADLDHLKPRQQGNRTAAGDRTGERTVEQCLSRQRRGDMLDALGRLGPAFGGFAPNNLVHVRAPTSR